MENASKALLIAGAILIAIILISIGMLILNSTTDVTDQVGDVTTSQAAQIFNSKFMPYAGIQSVSITRTLISEIATNNSTNSAGHKIYLSYNGPGSQIEFQDDPNTILQVLSSLLEGHKYKVKIERIDSWGYVQHIRIIHYGR